MVVSQSVVNRGRKQLLGQERARLVRNGGRMCDNWHTRTGAWNGGPQQETRWGAVGHGGTRWGPSGCGGVRCGLVWPGGAWWGRWGAGRRVAMSYMRSPAPGPRPCRFCPDMVARMSLLGCWVLVLVRALLFVASECWVGCVVSLVLCPAVARGVARGRPSGVVDNTSFSSKTNCPRADALILKL